MIKSFKVRLYPTKEQEQLMWKHIGARRYVWNYMIAKQIDLYKTGEKHLSGFAMSNLLIPLKNDGDHDWLYEISHYTLQKTCRDLDLAYQRFFKKKGKYPRFKTKKKSRNSFPVCDSRFYFKDDKYVKIQKLGFVKYKTDFDLPFGSDFKFYNPCIFNSCGKWILGFAMECESQVFHLTDKSMGIDLGIKDLAVVEFGGEKFCFHNINKSKKIKSLRKKLKHIQRSISRKYEQNRSGLAYVKTNNIVRLECKARKIHARITNIRKNYMHQTTYFLVSQLPCVVVMETLNVSGMLKCRYLSSAIKDQCFYEFINMMRYKCEWRGIEFVQADRFYPSSKACSNCGTIKSDLKLGDRVYRCECCGLEIDRDYNAAINLSKYVT